MYVYDYTFYLHTKLPIMIEVQNSFPIMPVFICSLLKYFMPCIELSYRYSCKSWLASSLLLFTTDRSYSFILLWSKNSLSIFFEDSIWFTVIFFTACRLCCEVFNIMMQKEIRTLMFAKMLTKYFTQNCSLDNASSTVCCFILLFDQNHDCDFIASCRKLCCCYRACKHSVSRLILNNLLRFVKLIKYRWVW